MSAVAAVVVVVVVAGMKRAANYRRLTFRFVFSLSLFTFRSRPELGFFFLVPAARWVVKNSKAFGARRVEVLRGGALENGAHWSHGGDTSCGTALASYFPHARVPFGLLFLVDLGIGQEF